MICSLRFYFKHIPEYFSAQIALEVLDHLSLILSLNYSHYKCTVYFDDDKSTGDVYSFPAGETGKVSLLNAIGNLHIKRDLGKLVSIFLAGISNTPKNEEYSPRCELFLTPGKMASHLSIDIPYDCQDPNMHLERYVQIIENLSSYGLIVNNSFCHTVSQWRQSYAFDSINVVDNPIAFRSPKAILNHASRHGSKHRLDCFANIYWGNSISISLLTPSEVQKITQILGGNYVRETAQSLIFVLSEFPRPFPTFLYKLLQIRWLLKHHIA